MVKPQVTITLGGSGQRVVKESWRDSNGGLSYPRSVVSGNKRSFREASAGSGGRSYSYNKKMREDANVRSYGYGGQIDESGVGPNDLRLKLTRKRIFRGIALQNEKHKKMELQEKASRAIRSLESSGDGPPRNVPHPRGAKNASQLDPVRGFSASWNSNAMRSRFPDQHVESSGRFYGPRSSIGERPQSPLVRKNDTSRMSNVFQNEPLGSSRPKLPISTTSRHSLNSGNLVAPLAPSTGGISVSPHADSQPLTVSGLLQSLGLTKYSVNFQAEEIDMVALKQMGDNDLKELGIPMGPRKKILLSIQPQTKCATILARSSSSRYAP